MIRSLIRASGAALLLLLSVAAFAGTLEVTAPTDGAFVGRNNTISFNIRQAVVQVTVRAQITGPGGTTSVQQQFTPNPQGEITGTLPLNFSPSNPEGQYTIVVTATEPGNSYTPVTINVTLDVTNPKFLQVNPLNNSFVKGVVPITVRVQEPNMKEMRIQVNDQDIPNNTSNQEDFTLLWDTTGIELDGDQTITVRVEDQAGNVSTKTIDVTLDRVRPTMAIQYPRTDSQIRRGSTFSVVLEVTDASESSVSANGIDVVLRKMDGTFIMRVARQAVQTSGGKLIWSGRVRWSSLLPNQFKVVASGVDKAGNFATDQEVVITIR
jgi:hypothetical protein